MANGKYISVVYQPKKKSDATKEIKGKVVDSKGEIVIGATIRVVSATIGTATDIDGNFTLRVPEDVTTLEVGFVGMKTQLVSIKDKTEVRVVMEEDNTVLEDVVVTGIFKKTKESYTGAVSTISKDEIMGNYSYIKISDIELSGIEKDYRKYSMQDSLIIPVTVKTEYDKSDLRYVWFIYKGSDMESVDTISRERDLVYPVVEDEGEYTVVLKVQNTVNQYAEYASTNLIVETAFSRGFYILKATESGGTELDFRSEDGKMGYNLLEKVLENPLTGFPKVLAQMMNYPYVDKMTNRKVVGHALGITTEDDVCLIGVKDMSLIHDRRTLFFGDNNTGKPGRFFRGMMKEHYLSGDGCYSIGAGDGMFGQQLSTGRFAYPSSISGGSKWLVYDRASWGFMYWDEEAKRFLHVSYNGEVTAFENGDGYYKPNDIRDELLYMGVSHYAGANDVYAVFQAPRVTERKLYKMKITSGSNPIDQEGTKVMDVAMKFNYASHYAICSYSSPIIYYIVEEEGGSKLYSYSFVSNKEVLVALQGLPEGESINFVSNRFWGAFGDTKYKFDYLVIGTTAGQGDYTLSMYEMVGGLPNGEPVIQFSGMGEVVDIQYMSPVFNETWEWQLGDYGLSY